MLITCSFEADKLVLVQELLTFIPFYYFWLQIGAHDELELTVLVLLFELIQHVVGRDLQAILDFYVTRFDWEVLGKAVLNSQLNHLQSLSGRSKTWFVGSRATGHHPDLI